MTQPGDYAAAWRAYNARMDAAKYAKFASCFATLTRATSASNATSLVSVGVGGCEFEELVLRDALRAVEWVTVVEPDAQFNSVIRDRIHGTRRDNSLQLDIINSRLQDYMGPCQQVDLVFLANMMSYITDCAEAQVRKCLEWLRPGGHLLVVACTWPNEDSATVGLSAPGHSFVTHERKLLSDLNLKYTVAETSVTFDLDPENLRDAMFILLNRVPTQEEVDTFLTRMQSHLIPGTSKIDLVYKFYLIQK